MLRSLIWFSEGPTSGIVGGYRYGLRGFFSRGGPMQSLQREQLFANISSVRHCSSFGSPCFYGGGAVVFSHACDSQHNGIFLSKDAVIHPVGQERGSPLLAPSRQHLGVQTRVSPLSKILHRAQAMPTWFRAAHVRNSKKLDLISLLRAACNDLHYVAFPSRMDKISISKHSVAFGGIPAVANKE